MVEIILSVLGCLVAFGSLWGSLWYKLGKLATEVKQHNLMLAEINRTLERFIIGKGG